MKLRLLITALTLGLSSLSAQVFTTFTIPDGSSNTGVMNLGGSTLGSSTHEDTLASSGIFNFNYAWQTFSPTASGTYTLGVQVAPEDYVMILYSGIDTFNNSSPGANLTSFNDDGYLTSFNGLSFAGSYDSNAGPLYEGWFNPIISNVSLTAGTSYVVAISTYAAADAVSLPTSFFLYGAAQVTVEGGSSFSAVPEPSTYAALAGLAVLGFVAYRRRQSRA